MADNVAITAGSGTTIAADEVTDGTLGTVKVQYVKLMDGALDGTTKAGVSSAGLKVDLGADNDVTNAGTFAVQVDAALPAGTNAIGKLAANSGVDIGDVDVTSLPATGKTCTTSVTRPADTTAYAANDCWSDSTSSPTSGGFTLTSAARASGGTGIITDIVITSSNDPATLLQGELWLFDQAVTNVNDNSAFAMSDSDVLNLVGVVPFTLQTTVAGSGTNSYAHVSGLNIGYVCTGSANLRFLVKVKNAYTPASGEVLQVRVKVQYTS